MGVGLGQVLGMLLGSMLRAVAGMYVERAKKERG